MWSVVKLPTVRVVIDSPAQMHRFGVALAQLLRAGDVLILAGGLGAGKTALTQGIGAGLDVAGDVTSPTFVISRIHPANRPGRPALVHVDAYRLGSFAEIDDLDLDAEVADSVTVVEWGEGRVERLADAHLRVVITPLPVAAGAEHDATPREVELRGVGGDWAARLSKLTFA